MSGNVTPIQPQRSSQGQGRLLRGALRPTDTLLVPETLAKSVSCLSHSLGTEQVGGIQTVPSIGADTELLFPEPHRGHSSVSASTSG